MKRTKPKYFSDHFNIDKAKLKELGVFDPILNFDTKLFVEPLLLKKSSNEIIKNSAKTFDQFFVDLLKLLRLSKVKDDMPWRQAERVVRFPEYKYTCIGYGSDSTNGSGSGAELNNKILQSAKDIIDFAKDDPSIFLLLPLLEEGVGADIISDMTQNIIDEDVCNFTVDIMQKIGLKGDCQHKARNKIIYELPYNPFGKCPIKLLPSDILSNLPLADSFDDWIVRMADINSDLRDSVSRHIGARWFKATKAEKKESLLDLLKNDKSFFVEVLKTIKEHNFDHYDLEEDCQGLHRWLKDSEKFITAKPSNQNVGFFDDNLESISLAVEAIIKHFKQSIEDEELWRIFWTNHYSKLTHTKEFYSQMLFYMVASGWVASKDSNLTCVRFHNKETKQVDVRFSVLGKFSVNVMVKNSDNYKGLEKGYQKQVKHGGSRLKEKDFYVVMNFDEEKSKQLEAIKKTEEKGFKVIEIDVAQQDISQEHGILDFELPELEFTDMLIEFDSIPALDDSYLYEKSKGGKKRHEKTDIIKRNVIKPIFITKRQENKQRKVSEIINVIIKELRDLKKESFEIFAKKYSIEDLGHLKDVSEYLLLREDGGQIGEWCYQISQGKF